MEIFVVAVFVIVIAIYLRAMYEDTHYEIEYKDIVDKRVVSTFKAVFFADLHNTRYGKNNEKLLRDIEAFNPDIILIAGDAFVSKEKERNLAARYVLQELCRKYRVIFTFGNHETKLRNPEKYRYTINCLDELAYKENLIVLNNEQFKLNINGTKLNIIGYEADLKYYRKFDGVRPTLEEMVEAVKTNACLEDEISLLLAHNPNFFDTYAEYGPDYVFSGHNHGGIVRLPFIGGVISTGYRPFPKYYGGEYVKGKTKMFVTRGLGSHTIRFRLFNMPQIHMFTFKNK